MDRDLFAKIESATISPEDAALLFDMIDKRRKLSIVADRHKNAICQRKDGRIYTSIGNGKKLISKSGESRDEFLLRLYETCYEDEIITIDTIWDDFFEAYKPGRSDETWHNALLYYRRFIQGTRIATMPLADIVNADVDDYFDGLSAQFVGERPAKFYAKIRTVLNAVFRYASRKRLIRYIPYSADFTEIATRFKQVKPPETWSRDEYAALLSSINEDNVYERCFHLQTLLGCRTGEMFALRFSDVTIDQHDRPVIRIQAHTVPKYTKREDGTYQSTWEVAEGTKGRRRNGIHDIPLGHEAQRLIAMCREKSQSGYLFERPDKPGVPLHPNTYNVNIKKLCVRAGVRYFSNYGARRLVVSQLEESGNHQALMQIMGWANDNTRNYATVIDDSMYDKVVNLGQQAKSDASPSDIIHELGADTPAQGA